MDMNDRHAQSNGKQQQMDSATTTNQSNVGKIAIRPSLTRIECLFMLNFQIIAKSDSSKVDAKADENDSCSLVTAFAL